jgi:hypothetical protein
MRLVITAGPLRVWVVLDADTATLACAADLAGRRTNPATSTGQGPSVRQRVYRQR